jgi:hypothetical protein
MHSVDPYTLGVKAGAVRHRDVGPVIVKAHHIGLAIASDVGDSARVKVVTGQSGEFLLKSLIHPLPRDGQRAQIRRFSAS